MPDWTKPMQQTFEYYTVDPWTWKDSTRLNNVRSCKITRDVGAETLGSATFEVTDLLGECYIRVYLITNQNGVRDKFPLGTFLVQTPSSNFDGAVRSVTMDAYTPLLELKENPPPIGYSLLKNTNIMEAAYMITREHVRAPVVMAECPTTLFSDFVAETNDTWLTFMRDLISNAKYRFDLDEMGRILFAPKQETASLQPVTTFDDSNSSILYPELSLNHDLYKIPNIVEVVYSDKDDFYYARAVNDDSGSPISTVNRGREIIHRITDTGLVGDPTEGQIKEYAENALKELSTLENKVSYSHGYYPVRVGDCVRLDYKRAGLRDVKARIVSQTITCTSGCMVSENAVFTSKLWK